mgnify:CR=1 FL=1
MKVFFVVAILLLLTTQVLAFNMENSTEVKEFCQMYKDLYNLFGLKPGANTKEVKTQFRVFSTKHHPDAGGNADHFARIVNIRDLILSENKGTYDELYKSVCVSIRDYFWLVWLSAFILNYLLGGKDVERFRFAAFPVTVYDIYSLPVVFIYHVVAYNLIKHSTRISHQSLHFCLVSLVVFSLLSRQYTFAVSSASFVIIQTSIEAGIYMYNMYNKMRNKIK